MESTRLVKGSGHVRGKRSRLAVAIDLLRADLANLVIECVTTTRGKQDQTIVDPGNQCPFWRTYTVTWQQLATAHWTRRCPHLPAVLKGPPTWHSFLRVETGGSRET